MFDMQACFQFFGVKRSTMALKASYRMLEGAVESCVWNYVPVYKSFRLRQGAFQATYIQQPRQADRYTVYERNGLLASPAQ